MNKMRMITLSFVALIFSCLNLLAQPPQQRDNISGGDFTQFQIDILTKQLNIESQSVDEFKKLYMEYAQKVDELQPKPQKDGGKMGNREGQGRAEGRMEGRIEGRPENRDRDSDNSTKPTPPTSEEIEAQILESFDMAEKNTALKREYYYKFRAILSPQQILKMYNVERRLRERIVSESNRRAEQK